MQVKTLFFLFMLGFTTSCFMEEGKIEVKLGKNAVGAQSDAVVSNITLRPDQKQLIVDGVNLQGVTSVKITGPSVNQTYDVDEQTTNQLKISAQSAFSFVADTFYSLILSTAQGDTTFTMNFTLDQMGANTGDVLQWDGAAWNPSPLSGMNLVGTWDATANTPSLADGGANTSPSGGDFYVVGTSGSTTIDGISTWNAGDWIMYNSGSNQWERVDNASGVTSFNGRTGGVTPAANDYNIDQMSDVDTTTSAPSSGDVLEWNGTNWVPATPSASGVTSVGATAPLASSGGATPTISLNNSGVTAGSYAKVTVDAKGIVTAGSALIASDIPAITDTMMSGIASNCGSGEVLKADGSGGFNCATDLNSGGSGDFLADGSVPMTGTLQINNSGAYIDYRPNATECSDGDVLKWTAANRWECASDDDTDTDTLYSAGTGLDLSGTTFSIPTDGVTATELADNAVDTNAIANSAVTDAKINDVSVAKIVNGANAYFLYRPNNVECTDGQVLKWTAADRWECAADAGSGGADATSLLGESLKSTLATDTTTDGQVLMWSETNTQWEVGTITDNDTTYSAGTGLDLTGTTFSIPTNGVTATQLADDAVDTNAIVDANVTTDKIANSAVTNAKISDVNVSKITSAASEYLTYAPNNVACSTGEVLELNASGQWICGTKTTDTDTTYSAGTGLDLTGTTFSIPTDGVTATELADNAVDTNAIANSAVTDAKINDVSVAKVANGAGAYFAYQPNNTECSDGEVLKWTASNRWECAADTDADTTYTVGTGLDLTGTILSISANGVGTTQLASSSVTDAKINDVSVSKVGNAAGAYFVYRPNNVACADGEVLSWDNTNSRWDCDSLTGSNWNLATSDLSYTAGSVSIGTSTQDASALFQLSSTTQGFLPPRMTTTERDAISSPAEGLLVFDTVLKKLFIYQNSTWVGAGVSGSFTCPSGFTMIESQGYQLGCIQNAEESPAVNCQSAINTCLTSYGGRLPSYSELYAAKQQESFAMASSLWVDGGGWSTHSGGVNWCSVMNGDSQSNQPSWDTYTNTRNYRCFIPASGGSSSSEASSITTAVSDPSGASAGDVYFNTTDNKLYTYSGTTWEEVASGGSNIADSNGVDIPTLSTAPSSPDTGQIYYNTTDNKLYVYNGTSWDEVGSGGSSSTSSLVDGWPDALVCDAGSATHTFILYGSNSSDETFYGIQGNSGSYWITYTTSTGAYKTHNNVGSYDCVTNAWSKDQLISNGKAKFFGGGNSGPGGSSTPNIQSVTKSDTFTHNTTTWTDIPGLTVTITPTNATSNLIINANVAASNSDANDTVMFRLTRDGIPIGVGDASGSRAQGTWSMRNGDTHRVETSSIQFVDSPATTSAVVYKVQVRKTHTYPGTVYINTSGVNADADYTARTISTLSVFEPGSGGSSLGDSDGIDVPNLTSAPSSPDTGQIYFNTTDNKLYIYNGTAWEEVGSGNNGSGGTSTWANFDGHDCASGCNITGGSGGVSSVTRNAAGDYTLNFGTALSTSNYAVAVNCSHGFPGDSSYSFGQVSGTKTSTSVRVLCRHYTSGVLWDSKHVSVIITDGTNGANSAGQTIISDWPDFIKCSGSGYSYVLGLTNINTTYAEYNLAPNGSSTSPAYVRLNISDGSANGSSAGSYNSAGMASCTGKSLSTLEADGQTFNVVSGSKASGVVSGTYNGDGATGQDINLGFRPSMVVVKAAGGTYNGQMITIDGMPDNVPHLRNYDGGNHSDNVLKITATGFRVEGPANDSSFNVNGFTYYYIAFTNDSEHVTSDHLGNHTATQNLKLGSNYISNDGDASEGLSFDTSGNATLSGTVTAASFSGSGANLTNIPTAAIDNNAITVDKVDFASSDGINIPQVASAPSSPATGQMYFNTTDNKLYLYNGTSWEEVGSNSSGGSSGNTLVSGFPDIIKCNITTPNLGTSFLYLELGPYVVDGNYYYKSRDGVWLTVNPTTKVVSNYASTVSSDCNGVTTTSLYSSGKAFNIAGGSGSSSEDRLILVDEKASGTEGGTCTAGSYATRDLNTIKQNTITGASLSSNQITLPAGTYQFEVSAPAYRVARHKAKLYNVTDSVDALIGTSEISHQTNDYTSTRSTIKGTLTITSSKVFDIRHRCESTNTTYGFGVASSFGDTETYTKVEITKLNSGGGSSALGDNEGVDVPNLASAPSSPDTGQVYFNTTDNKLYLYNGTIWEEVGSNSGGTSTTGIIDPVGMPDIIVCDSGTNEHMFYKVFYNSAASGNDQVLYANPYDPAGYVYYNDTTGARGGLSVHGGNCPTNISSITKTYSLGGGSNFSTTSALVNGWPDAIVCEQDSDTSSPKQPRIFFYGGNSSNTNDTTYYFLIDNAAIYFNFNSDKSWNAHTGASGYSTCLNKSISTLISEGKAKYFGNDVGSIAQDDDNDTKIMVEKNADEDAIRFDTNGSERAIIDSSGNIGVGTSTPAATLDVNGTIKGKAAVDNTDGNNDGDTIDFANGNLQYTNDDCQAFILHNVKDGASYTFAVKGATPATCTFTAYSDAGTTSLTVHHPTDNGNTIASKHTIYTFLVMGTDVYISWVSGL